MDDLEWKKKVVERDLEMERRVTQLEADTRQLMRAHEQGEGMPARMATQEQKMDAMDKKLDRVEQTLERIDKQLTADTGKTARTYISTRGKIAVAIIAAAGTAIGAIASYLATLI